jgi:hypothetical protein
MLIVLELAGAVAAGLWWVAEISVGTASRAAAEVGIRAALTVTAGSVPFVTALTAAAVFGLANAAAGSAVIVVGADVGAKAVAAGLSGPTSSAATAAIVRV